MFRARFGNSNTLASTDPTCSISIQPYRLVSSSTEKVFHPMKLFHEAVAIPGIRRTSRPNTETRHLGKHRDRPCPGKLHDGLNDDDAGGGGGGGRKALQCQETLFLFLGPMTNGGLVLKAPVYHPLRAVGHVVFLCPPVSRSSALPLCSSPRCALFARELFHSQETRRLLCLQIIGVIVIHCS